MEFKHINLPEFDRARDKAISPILEAETYGGIYIGRRMRIAVKSYNEGYKQALRDWVSTLGDRYSFEFVSDLIAEVDRLIKGDI